MPIALADVCDTFCQQVGYDYGSCREVSEAICTENEDAYGFDYCDNYERCCCGSDVTE